MGESHKGGRGMRLILYLGAIALLAAIGSSLGQEYYQEMGRTLGAFIGGVFGLLVVASFRAVGPK